MAAIFDMRLPLMDHVEATERPRQAAEGASRKSLNFDEEEAIQRRIVPRHVENNLDTC
jgi:hypothetical protein